MARPLHTLRITLAWALIALGAPSTAIATSPTALPSSDYTVRPACGPPAPGRASCLALELAPRAAPAIARVHPRATLGAPHTGLAKASECARDYPASCLTPKELASAYFPGEKPEAPAATPQTIALVDAYNDLNAEADLATYTAEFGLPPCGKSDGCFQKVGESGGEAPSALPFPKSSSELEAFAAGTQSQRAQAEEAEGWALETATDIEVARAVCQNCHILLVEANGPEYSELEHAEDRAVALGGTEVSNSWGGPEAGADAEAFNHPGIAIVAATGDDGYLNWDQYATREAPGSPYFEGADYPAASPHVISVGGTHLNLTPSGTWESETVWNSEGAGGSGCSTSLLAPAWQRGVPDWAQVGCGAYRANADVSADADPTTGVDVYDSTAYPYEENGKTLSTVLHWVPIGGTSVASPIIASMVALAGGAHGVAYPAQTLYSHLGTPLLHDVSSGGNGECDENYSTCEGSLTSPLDCGPGVWICNATSGYDGPTGVGTPNGIGAFRLSEEGAHTTKPGEEPSKSTGSGSGGGGGSKESSGGGSGSEAGGNSGGTGKENGTGSGGGTSKAGSSEGTLNEGGTTPGGNTTKQGTSAGAGAGAGANAGAGATKENNGSLLGSIPDTALAPTRITELALTANARAALRRDRITISALAFSCTLTRAASIRATLAIQVRSGAHRRWRSLVPSLTFAAARGTNRRRLHGSSELAPGLYRLTLTPSGGEARSLSLRVP